MMKNKKGDKLISIYWFAILVLVAGGIVAMVNVFYSSPYDVREVEAEVLSNKISDCIYFGGKYDLRLMSIQGVFKEEFKDNFLEKCHLNFTPREQYGTSDYYAEVNFYPLTSDESVFILKGGNMNFKSDCEIEEKLRKNLVSCSKKVFYSKSYDGKFYRVEILSVVRNSEKNV